MYFEYLKLSQERLIFILTVIIVTAEGKEVYFRYHSSRDVSSPERNKHNDLHDDEHTATCSHTRILQPRLNRIQVIKSREKSNEKVHAIILTPHLL